jgi:hypothetical protein
MISTAKILTKSLKSPDEILAFEKEKIEIVNLGNVTIARVTLEPGWRWDKHVKPRVNTKLRASTYIIDSVRKSKNYNG